MVASSSADAPLCAAPDREPRAPRLALPAGACDCHAHICGPANRFPYSDERIYTPPDATLADYLTLLGRLGVDRAVLVQPSVYGADNAAMTEAMRIVGPGVRGVAVVDAAISAREVEALHVAGVRGVRLNLVDRRGARNQMPVETVRALAGRIAPHGWHIEFLVNLDEADGFESEAAGLPVPIVLGHMGYPRAGARGWSDAPGFASLLRMLEGGRCWVKMTGPYRISGAPDLPYEDVDAAARQLVRAAPERLLWGTDWPHVMMKKPMPNDGDLSDLLERWIPTSDARMRILTHNPAELYGFDPAERIAP